jgi:NAD(P)-dependent dehydrogenase (short-subunit alcohol dehydrogenase family)
VGGLSSFAGRRVLVTGGSRGIGLEVARLLAERNAEVIVAARDPRAVTEAVAGLPGSGHAGLILDVADTASWHSAMSQIDAGGALHGLVTSAGVLGPIGGIDDVDPTALVRTVEINLLGTMLALHHAVPRLQDVNGRAVTFSGGGGTSPLPRYDAYAATKAGVVRVTENIAAAGDVEVNAVAPGFVATRMHEGTLGAGPAAAGDDYYERTRAQLADGGFPARQAAELVAFLLSEEARGITGRLISAQWDPWRDNDFRKSLRDDPNLGRLRRIDDQFFTAGHS